MARECCDYHRHVDNGEPFAAGVDVTWCGEDARMADWDRLGLRAYHVVHLPSPPEPECECCPCCGHDSACPEYVEAAR